MPAKKISTTSLIYKERREKCAIYKRERHANNKKEISIFKRQQRDEKAVILKEKREEINAQQKQDMGFYKEQLKGHIKGIDKICTHKVLTST